MNKHTTTLAVLTFALLVRGASLVVGWDSLSADFDSYARLAITWSNSGVFGFETSLGDAVRATAFRPPLYPWLLSFLVADGELLRGGVAGLHLLLGLASVWLTLDIGRRLGLRQAWLAAAAVTLDPLLLRAGQLVMTETLAAFTALVAWRLWLVVWPPQAPQTLGASECSLAKRAGRQWLALALLGGVFGLSILARPTAAPWAALCLLSMLWVGQQGWQWRLFDLLVVTAGIAVCLLPWTLRNARELGKPVWATTHGGYTLLLANNPLLYQHFIQQGPSRAWDAEPFHRAWEARSSATANELLEQAYWLTPQQPLDPPAAAVELADDELANAAAKATIARQPELFALSCLYRVGWLWAAWPNESWRVPSTLAIGLWYSVWYLLAIGGLYGLWRQRSLRSWLPALLLLAALTAVHAVYWSNMRMRGPLMPVVYLLAASTWPMRLHPTPKA